MKKKVLVRGPLLSLSGYGNHSREVVKWLLKREDVDIRTQVLPWGITPWILDKNTGSGLIGKIMDVSIDRSDENFDVSYQIQLPNEWDADIATKNVGVTAAVETDICHPSWVSCCNKMDSVVVPSQFTKKTLKRSGEVVTPIQVIPESFIEEIVTEKHALDVEFSTGFNFLLFGMLTGHNPNSDRKNLFYTIKWLLEEFKDCPDVGIVLKTSKGRGTKIDRKVTENIIHQIIKEVRVGPYPKIHFLHGSMTSSEVASIYRHPQIKALVSLTRGEGYGLPILEAAASDLPVVATNWSGHLDFMNKGKFVSIDYDMTPIHESRIDGRIFIEGSRWANPIEKDAKKKMRKLYESYKIPKQWAKSLGKTLRSSLTHDDVCAFWDDNLNGLI